ncbi:unnamed protein product [Triticum turgidum subsp. durum]|uniref:USP domain-containing protein n=1 Tax=Triticum turgidum subsp. durum TaxID=4567 RepID=A0A9R0TD63_TRITD|nr:unnamed protein product [Triticum turgidum subsp. durum]
MVNATALVKSFFVMPKENTYILFRIEFLVVITTLIFLGMSILDIFRGQFHSAIGKAILSIVDGVSDSIVIYVMGVMQAAPFKNQLFPVWAIVLVSFRHSSDFISGYGIRDKDGRRFNEWRNVMKLLGVAFLNKTRGSTFAYPLWSLWSMQVLRSKYRLFARNQAFRSFWHGKSSQLISEYMRTDTHWENFKLKDWKAETMEGHRYLVYGETRRHIKFKKPRYVLQMDTNPQETRAKARAKVRAARGLAPVEAAVRPFTESLVTLDRIWQCDGALLHQDSTQGDNMKDLALAFSLSRLLRCRLEDVSLHKGSTTPITKNLVMLRIIQEEANRAFGVMELEMSFVNDYFNTRYPIVFCMGFPSLHLNTIMSVATFAFTCWLSVDIRRVYKTPKDEISHVIRGINVDMIITWFFMSLMMFKEVWEMVSYFLSDWTRLLLVCTYVRWARRYMRNGCMEKFISSFFTSKIVDTRGHGVLDQYAFLQSYNESPTIWNCVHIVSTGAIPKKEAGAQLSDHINIPECVKPAIQEALCTLDLTRAHLPGVIPSLLAESRERYRWPCIEQPTSSHVILVWHIATSLCEIKFAQDRDIDLSNPGVPLRALLYLTSFCRSAQPYLVDENMLDGSLKTRYIVANSLSRYCAYLLVAKPDLLPDSFLVPKLIHQETVKDARQILKGSDSLDKKYKTLIDEAGKRNKDTSNSKEIMGVVHQGAKLAKELIDNENEESCWEIMAGVWADLLVHIAPSWNAAAHKKCLDSGGEFITHIWALLCHCGIDTSMLWPVEGLRKNDSHGAPWNSNAENNISQTPQDAHAMERDDKQGILTAATADGVSFVNGNTHMIRGMPNLGNTCYFNAVLQSLLALGELRVKLLEQNPPAGCLHLELRKLFEEAAGGANDASGTLDTQNLFSIMSSMYPDLNVRDMEDSNTLLVYLLDGLSNEEPTIVESLFRGQIAEHVSSKECQHTLVTTQVLHLSLAIPSKQHVSVEDCLDLHVTGEINGWYCETCSAAYGNASSNQEDAVVDEDQTQQSDSATYQIREHSSHPAEQQTSAANQDKGKLPMLNDDAHAMELEQNQKKHKEENKIYRAAKVHFLITKAPPLLTIQLKRFDYVTPGRSDKLDEHVRFHEILDITKFMDPRCAADDVYKYWLVAVIVHKGSKLSEGHNYSYVRASSIEQENGITHSWFCASDQNVVKVSLEEVLNCQAYILFYTRVEQSKAESYCLATSPTTTEDDYFDYVKSKSSANVAQKNFHKFKGKNMVIQTINFKKKKKKKKQSKDNDFCYACGESGHWTVNRKFHKGQQGHN